MFGDRKYCERNDAGLGFKNVEVLEHEKKADQFTIRIRYTASANVPLPDFAKKFVPAEMSITQRDSWDLKKRTGQLEVEVRGVPIKIAATMRLADEGRSEEHTSELQSLMRISYAVFCLKKKNNNQKKTTHMIYHNQYKTASRT